MFIKRVERRGESGSVLMVTLITALILGISLTSYLLLIQHQHRMVARSQAWNHALAMAEAGVEDALAHLNRDFGVDAPRGGLNGWNGSAAGPASLPSPRSLEGGTYTATISADALPVVTATGRVRLANSSQFIERSVRVEMTTRPAFVGAMVAKGNIDFKGNNIEVDSYDSGDPDHSNALGLYDPAKRKAGGDVASTEGFIEMGNADVKGKLYTGPLNEGQYSIGANGSVGDLNWNGPGIQDGWYYNDFNMEVTSVTAPYTTGVLPAGTSTNKWELLNGFDYMVNGSVSVGPQETILVRGNATVFVTGNFEMRGKINIAPGASLKLYVAGNTAQLNEVNTTGTARSFQYYGLPTNKTMSWTGNNAYVGTVYAPQASYKLGGGGSDEFDYQGACVVESVVVNGHFKFHYDEDLKKSPLSGFAVSRWEEL